MDADNIRFSLAFHDLSPDRREGHPLTRWVAERCELIPNAVVPVRYLLPDWLEFWRDYQGGKYKTAAFTCTLMRGRLTKTIQQWATPPEYYASGSLRLLRPILPITPTVAVDWESGRQEQSLRGIKLLKRGRLLGDMWSGVIGAHASTREAAEANKGKTRDEIRAERKARQDERRTEDLAIKRAIQAGVSLDQTLAALQHVPGEGMDVGKLFDWITKGYPASLRLNDPIFG